MGRTPQFYSKNTHQIDTKRLFLFWGEIPTPQISRWVSGYHPYLVVLLLFVSWFNNTAADSALFIRQDGSPERKMPRLVPSLVGEIYSYIYLPRENTRCKSHPPSSICSSLQFETGLKKDSTLKKNTHANIMKYGSVSTWGEKGRKFCTFCVYSKNI